jgi:hypothetical protein
MKNKNLIYYIGGAIAIILLYNYFKKGNLPASRSFGGKTGMNCPISCTGQYSWIPNVTKCPSLPCEKL